MAQYMLLLRNDPDEFERLTDEEGAAVFQRFVEWAERLHREKRLVGVDRLALENTRTVRKRGSAFVVDGPFCEAKDAITGYFMIEARDAAEALEIAQGAPSFSVPGSSVEIRELAPFPKPRG